MRSERTWVWGVALVILAFVAATFTSLPRGNRSDLVGSWYGESETKDGPYAFLFTNNADGQFQVEIRGRRGCGEFTSLTSEGTWRSSWLIMEFLITRQGEATFTVPASQRYFLLSVAADKLRYARPYPFTSFTAARVDEDFAFAECYETGGAPPDKRHAR